MDLRYQQSSVFSTALRRRLALSLSKTGSSAIVRFPPIPAKPGDNFGDVEHFSPTTTYGVMRANRTGAV
jgi:hypothetical protein